MDAVWFLVVALGLICVGTVIVALRYREPRREDAGIDAHLVKPVDYGRLRELLNH